MRVREYGRARRTSRTGNSGVFKHLKTQIPFPLFSYIVARSTLPSWIPAGDLPRIPARFRVFRVLFRSLSGLKGKVVQQAIDRAPLYHISGMGRDNWGNPPSHLVIPITEKIISRPFPALPRSHPARRNTSPGNRGFRGRHPRRCAGRSRTGCPYHGSGERDL